MSLAISQTSAARIVRSARPTEADVDRLVREFHLHPLDAEGLLRVPEHSATDKFRDYTQLTWCLPWPTAQGPVSIDLRFIVGPKFLIIIGDTPDGAVESAIEQATAEPLMNEGGASAIFSQVIQSVATAAATHSSLPVPDPKVIVNLLRHASDVLHKFLESFPALNISIGDDDRRLIALAVHRLKHAAEKVPTEPVELKITAPVVSGTKMAAGYTFVSIVVLLVVLAWR